MIKSYTRVSHSVMFCNRDMRDSDKCIFTLILNKPNSLMSHDFTHVQISLENNRFSH